MFGEFHTTCTTSDSANLVTGNDIVKKYHLLNSVLPPEIYDSAVMRAMSKLLNHILTWLCNILTMKVDNYIICYKQE